jgi:hypothetical protein
MSHVRNHPTGTARIETVPAAPARSGHVERGEVRQLEHADPLAHRLALGATTSNTLSWRKLPRASRPSSEIHFGRSQPNPSVNTQPLALSFSYSGEAFAGRPSGRSSPGGMSRYMSRYSRWALADT